MLNNIFSIIFGITKSITTFVQQLKNMQLEPNIKEKLLNDNAATCKIAIKMNCSQQNIVKLLKSNSPKLCQLNYAVVIKQTLKMPQSAKIYID